VALSQEIIDRTLHAPHGDGGYRVVEILLDAGFEAWWVGGCVRDMFLGHIPDDIDIATNALPNEISALFPKSDDTAAHLGAIVVSYKGHTYELTTFREEHEISNGRHPESVSFSDREADAKRRDITINAMYWHPISGELYDPYEGEKDLSEKLVRIIGDPEVRIAHDSLRLLRIIRFRALIDGQYHPDTFHALHALSQTIEVLSGERRFRELQKMLLGPCPERAFEDLWETDIIEHLIPELHKCKGVAQPPDYHKEGDVWEHTMLCISAFTDDHSADIRWATLFHDIGKTETFSITDRIHFDGHASASANSSDKILTRLQCPKKKVEKIHWLIEHHMMMGNFVDMNTERKAHWYYHPWFIELLQLFWLDIEGTRPQGFELYESIISDYNEFLDSHPLPPKPLLSGEDVMDILGIQPGEKVGEAIKQLYEAQLRKEISTKKEAKEFVSSLSLQ
jgi:tRNA nucleotidyltransferase/poly(A) polymerase